MLNILFFNFRLDQIKYYNELKANAVIVKSRVFKCFAMAQFLSSSIPALPGKDKFNVLSNTQEQYLRSCIVPIAFVCLSLAFLFGYPFISIWIIQEISHVLGLRNVQQDNPFLWPARSESVRMCAKERTLSESYSDIRQYNIYSWYLVSGCRFY